MSPASVIISLDQLFLALLIFLCMLIGFFWLTMQTNAVKHLSGHLCQICGSPVELTESGGTFVACIECAFPVCRPCYEYEWKEGSKCCPQCKTKYKRHKG